MLIRGTQAASVSAEGDGPSEADGGDRGGGRKERRRRRRQDVKRKRG